MMKFQKDAIAGNSIDVADIVAPCLFGYGINKIPKLDAGKCHKLGSLLQNYTLATKNANKLPKILNKLWWSHARNLLGKIQKEKIKTNTRA